MKVFPVRQGLDIEGRLILINRTKEFGFSSAGKEGTVKAFSFFLFLNRRNDVMKFLFQKEHPDTGREEAWDRARWEAPVVRSG